jgi:hypothetical protein
MTRPLNFSFPSRRQFLIGSGTEDRIPGFGSSRSAGHHRLPRKSCCSLNPCMSRSNVACTASSSIPRSRSLGRTNPAVPASRRKHGEVHRAQERFSPHALRHESLQMSTAVRTSRVVLKGCA